MTLVWITFLGIVAIWIVVFVTEVAFWRLGWSILDVATGINPVEISTSEASLHHVSRWILAPLVFAFIVGIVFLGVVLLLPPTVAVRRLARLTSRCS